MNIFLCAILMCITYFFSFKAHSWDFEEHYYLGKVSYEIACKELLKGEELNSEQKKSLTEIACDKNIFLSQRYGRATALAGDHFDSPDQFTSNSVIGLRNTNSILNYASLALKNEQHFYPSVQRFWRKYHLMSLKTSTTKESVCLKDKTRINSCSNSELGAEKKIRFFYAFYQNAFGDHFLHDSFSSGHIGVNRVSASPAISNYLHDIGNENGKILTNRNRDIWISLGDGRLFTKPEKSLIFSNDKKNNSESDKSLVLNINPEFDYKITKLISKYSGGIIRIRKMIRANVKTPSEKYVLSVSILSVKSFLHSFFAGSVDENIYKKIEDRLPTGYDIFRQDDKSSEETITIKPQFVDVSEFQKLDYIFTSFEFSGYLNRFENSELNAYGRRIAITTSNPYFEFSGGFFVGGEDFVYQNIKYNTLMLLSLRTPRMYRFPSILSSQIEISYESPYSDEKNTFNTYKLGLRTNIEIGKNYPFITIGGNYMAGLGKDEFGVYLNVGFMWSYDNGIKDVPNL